MKNLVYFLMIFLIGCGEGGKNSNSSPDVVSKKGYLVDDFFDYKKDLNLEKKLIINEHILQEGRLFFFKEQEEIISNANLAKEFLERNFKIDLKQDPMQTKVTKNFTSYKFIQNNQEALRCGSSINLQVDNDKKAFKAYVRKIDNFSNCKTKDNYYLKPRDIVFAKPPEFQISNQKEVDIKVFDPDPITSSNNTFKMPKNSQDFYASEDFSKYIYTKKVKALEKDNKIYLSNNFAMAVDVQEFLEDGKLVKQAHQQGITSIEKNKNFDNTDIGDIKFLEQMAFFHISQSLSELALYGYENLIEKPLYFDALLWDNDNKTAYYPDLHLMALSAGAINDGLDASVIYHELAHAIIYALSKDFDGGDTGGIHEGFADYWAGQYIQELIKTKSLDNVDKYELFKLDGHYSNKTRRLDRMGKYSIFSGNYLAHQTYNGIISDELVSGALFSALEKSLGLYKNAKEEINEILIESFMGSGYGLKIHQFALTLIQTAQKLYPNKKYSFIFEEEFKKRNMIYEKINLNLLQNHITQGDKLSILMQNVWFEDLQDIELLLLNEKGENLASKKIISLESGKTIKLDFDLPNFECKKTYKLKFIVNFNKDEKLEYEKKITIGKVIIKDLPQVKNIDIPKATKTNSALTQAKNGLLERNIKINKDIAIDENFVVILDIEGGNKNDLNIILKSPNGKTITLEDNVHQNSIKQIYTTSNKLQKIKGDNAKGRWFLQISNSNLDNSAKLRHFGISKIIGLDCKAANQQNKESK